VVVECHHQVRAVPADRRGQVAAQRRPILDQAVGVVEELHRVDPDDRRAGALFGLAHRGACVGGHAVDTGLAAAGEQIRHVLACSGPRRHRPRCAILQIVGMGHDRQRPFPVARQRREAAGPAVG
jgi:hypothetical protein